MATDHTSGSGYAGSKQSARPLRADAQRNRDRLVAGARAVLARADGTFSLEEVAREAGVGIGTLYRHFPTRDALVETVYGAELDELTASAPALLDELPPETALREWVMRYAGFTARKRGMMDILRAGLARGSIQAPVTRTRITGAIAPIIAAGARAGSLREDVDPDDVTMLLLGVFLSTSAEPDTDRTERLLGLVLDVLRPGTAPSE